MTWLIVIFLLIAAIIAIPVAWLAGVLIFNYDLFVKIVTTTFHYAVYTTKLEDWMWQFSFELKMTPKNFDLISDTKYPSKVLSVEGFFFRWGLRAEVEWSW
jgi:hypothetical protein